MKQNKLSKIGAFFKARLHPDNMQPADWNTPEDDILDGVFAILDEPVEKPQRKIPWIIMLVLLLGCSIGFHFIKVVELKDQITELEDNNSHKKNEDISFIDESIESKNLNDNSTQSQKHLIIEATQRASKELKELANIQTFKNNQNIKEVHSMNTKSMASGNTLDIKFEGNYQNTSNSPSNADEHEHTLSSLKKDLATINHTIPKSRNETIQSCDTIPFLALQLDKPIDTISLEHLAATALEENISQSKIFYAGLGHLLTSYDIENVNGDYNNLWGYKNLSSGWSAEVGIQFKIAKNTFVSTKIGYKNINNKSTYKEELPYDSNNEYQNISGETMYDQALSVSTTMGMFDDHIIMNMSDNIMQDGDLMQHKSEINQSLHVLTFGVELEQKVYRLNDLSFSVYAALAANKVLAWNQDLETYITMNLDKEYDFSYRDDSMAKTNFLFLDSALGIRAAWVINENLSIDLSSAYMRSLNPINKITNSKDAKTFIKGFQSNAGIRYSF